MMSTDESGIERILRGKITEISKPLLSAAEGLQRMELSSLRRWRNLVGTKHSRCFWKFEQFWPSTKSRVVVGTASDSAANATCTMRMCELAMPHLSLHWSNQPRTAGPGWKLTMDNVTSRMNLRITWGAQESVGRSSAHRAGEADTISNESCCVRTLVRGVCVCESERNRSTASETDE